MLSVKICFVFDRKESRGVGIETRLEKWGKSSKGSLEREKSGEAKDYVLQHFCQPCFDQIQILFVEIPDCTLCFTLFHSESNFNVNFGIPLLPLNLFISKLSSCKYGFKVKPIISHKNDSGQSATFQIHVQHPPPEKLFHCQNSCIGFLFHPRIKFICHCRSVCGVAVPACNLAL